MIGFVFFYEGFQSDAGCYGKHTKVILALHGRNKISQTKVR